MTHTYDVIQRRLKGGGQKQQMIIISVLDETFQIFNIGGC